MLKIAWQVGVWFHRTFKDPNFKSFALKSMEAKSLKPNEKIAWTIMENRKLDMVIKHGADPVGLAGEEPRPSGVVVGQGDRCVVGYHLADRQPLEVLVADRGRLGLIHAWWFLGVDGIR